MAGVALDTNAEQPLFRHGQSPLPASVSATASHATTLISSYDTDEVLDDTVGDVSRRDEVLAAIRESFDDDIWVERNMFSLNGVHKYVASWDRFCDAVKHRTRFFFDHDQEDGSHDTIPVPHMLNTLREMVEESGLIRTLAP